MNTKEPIVRITGQETLPCDHERRVLSSVVVGGGISVGIMTNPPNHRFDHRNIIYCTQIYAPSICTLNIRPI